VAGESAVSSVPSCHAVNQPTSACVNCGSVCSCVIHSVNALIAVFHLVVAASWLHLVMWVLSPGSVLHLGHWADFCCFHHTIFFHVQSDLTYVWKPIIVVVRGCCALPSWVKASLLPAIVLDYDSCTLPNNPGSLCHYKSLKGQGKLFHNTPILLGNL